MAILQNDKVVYYHPCDSVVDASGVTWNNPVLWGETGTFPSGLLNDSYSNGDMGASGYYTNNNGANRVTIAFWGYDQLSISRINVGFVNTSPEQYQILQINATDDNIALFLGSNSSDIIWSGITITGSGWHFSVFDLERLGNDWILRHSRDGSPWVEEPPQSGLDFYGTHNNSHIAAGDIASVNRVDEVVLWRDADLFTSAELCSLHKLGSLYGLTMDQYIPLCEKSADVDLFIYSSPRNIYAAKDLFVFGSQFITTFGDLFIEGLNIISSSESQLRIVHHLVRTGDYNPQLVGSFDNGGSSVNIRVWDIVGGINTQLNIENSGCYSIGNTGKWGWSTRYLPVVRGYGDYHYYFEMIADNDEVEYGEFFLTVPERGRWVHIS